MKEKLQSQALPSPKASSDYFSALSEFLFCFVIVKEREDGNGCGGWRGEEDGKVSFAALS